LLKLHPAEGLRERPGVISNDEAHVDQSVMSSYEQTRLPSACLEEHDKLKPDGMM